MEYVPPAGAGFGERPCPSCAEGKHSRHEPRWGVSAGLLDPPYRCECDGTCKETVEAQVDSALNWGNTAPPSPWAWESELARPETHDGD